MVNSFVGQGRVKRHRVAKDEGTRPQAASGHSRSQRKQALGRRPRQAAGSQRTKGTRPNTVSGGTGSQRTKGQRALGQPRRQAGTKSERTKALGHRPRQASSTLNQDGCRQAASRLAGAGSKKNSLPKNRLPKKIDCKKTIAKQLRNNCETNV